VEPDKEEEDAERHRESVLHGKDLQLQTKRKVDSIMYFDVLLHVYITYLIELG